MKMIKNGIVLAFAGAAMLFVGCQSVASCAEESKATNPRPEGVYTTGKAKFTLGVAGYTYHKKNIDQTLADMKSLDIRNLCVKDFHLPIKATQAEVDAFKKKCAEHNVNIVDVSQTVLRDMFTMIMLVDISEINVKFGDFSQEMEEYGKGIGMEIRAMHEDIFNSMHRI